MVILFKVEFDQWKSVDGYSVQIFTHEYKCAHAFVCVACDACVALTSPRCFSISHLRLNIKSIAFTYIDLNLQWLDTVRASIKQTYTRLPPPLFEGRYFEVAQKFLWSSQEQPKIKKRQMWTWAGEKTVGEEWKSRSVVSECETRLSTHEGYTTQ